MKNFIDRLTQEPNLVTGAITATFNALVLLSVITISTEAVAGINVAIGAWFVLIRRFVTPSSQVVVQQKPGGPVTAATDLQGVSKGETVWVAPASPPGGPPQVDGPPPEGGYLDLLLAAAVVVLSLGAGTILMLGWHLALLLLVGLVLIGAAVVYRYRQAMTAAFYDVFPDGLHAARGSKVGGSPG